MTLLPPPPPPPPPPPLPARGPRRSRWEAELLREWEPRLRHMALRVFRPGRISFTTDDVIQELRLGIILAARAYACDSDGKPSEAFIRTVLKNTAASINRLTASKKRSALNPVEPLLRRHGLARAGPRRWSEPGLEMDDPLDRVASPMPGSDEQMVMAEAEAGLRGLVYLLRERLSPAAFAVLHLRFVEEWGPEVVVTATGRAGAMEWICDACGRRSHDLSRRCCARPSRNRQEPVSVEMASQRMSQAIVAAKKQAIDFLASIGVQAFRDLEDETCSVLATSR